MNKYIFSIIIPHYNTPEKLRRLLRSIPDEEYIQIIVVDDISTEYVDVYEDVKKEFDVRARFLENTINNKNAGGARNLGLGVAEGEWILFADSDDFFLDTFLDAIISHKDDSEDIVFFPPCAVYENKNATSSRYTHYARLALDYYCCGKRHIRRNEWKLRLEWYAPWSKMIRRRMIEENNVLFDLTQHANDVMFSVKTGVMAKSISASYETIYCITSGETSLTACKEAEPEKARDLARFNRIKYISRHVSLYNRLVSGNYVPSIFWMFNNLPKRNK